MKMLFRGWGREGMPHRRTVVPVREEGRFYALPRGPVRWVSPLKARGKINNLALTGNFLLEVEFSEAELKNWLIAQLKADYTKALKLMTEAQIAVASKLVSPE